jgi:dsRNA-specific ribonuclease
MVPKNLGVRHPCRPSHNQRGSLNQPTNHAPPPSPQPHNTQHTTTFHRLPASANQSQAFSKQLTWVCCPTCMWAAINQLASQRNMLRQLVFKHASRSHSLLACRSSATRGAHGVAVFSRSSFCARGFSTTKAPSVCEASTSAPEPLPTAPAPVEQADDWELYKDPDYPGYGKSRTRAYFACVEQFLQLPNAELTVKEAKTVHFERYAGDVDSTHRLYRFQATLDGNVIATAVEKKMYLARGAAASAALRSLGKYSIAKTYSDAERRADELGLSKEDWRYHTDPNDPEDKTARKQLYSRYEKAFLRLPNSKFSVLGRWLDSDRPHHRCEARIDGEIVAFAVAPNKKAARGAAAKLALKARGCSID